MKSLVQILACLTITYAQGIAIYSPSTGDTLSPGQDTVVQIATPVCMHTKLETQSAHKRAAGFPIIFERSFSCYWH